MQRGTDTGLTGSANRGRPRTEAPDLRVDTRERLQYTGSHSIGRSNFSFKNSSYNLRLMDSFAVLLSTVEATSTELTPPLSFICISFSDLTVERTGEYDDNCDIELRLRTDRRRVCALRKIVASLYVRSNDDNGANGKKFSSAVDSAVTRFFSSETTNLSKYRIRPKSTRVIARTFLSAMHPREKTVTEASPRISRSSRSHLARVNPSEISLPLSRYRAEKGR